jgi:hypothetical protein
MSDNIKLELIEIGAVVWTEFIWLTEQCSGGLFEYGNEYLDTIKCGEFLNSWISGGFPRRPQIYGVSSAFG